MASRIGARRAIGFGLVLAVAFATTAARAAVFGLLDTSELYSSTNTGTTWAPLSALPASDAIGLAAGVSTSDLYIATRSGTLYHSSNGGSSWSAVGAVAASDLASFIINYDGAVLVLTESGTLYRSTNGGATFTGFAALTGSDLVAIARGPLGRLYTLSRTGEVYESQNQGANWAPVGSIAVSNAVSIRRRGSLLFVLTETGEVYRSIDYGRAWLPVGTITASNMAAILDAGSVLLAGAGTGEIYSSANGTSWTPVGVINQSTVVSLGVDTPQATGVSVEEATPRFMASAPYPNPTTWHRGSRFEVVTTSPDQIRLELFDIHGRRIAELKPAPFDAAGSHGVSWKPPGLATGTYLVRVISGSGRSTTVKWSIVE